MALGIYKPGQGYWTRVLTAVGLGVLILAGVGWITGQLKAIPVERTSWELEIVAITGEPKPGQRLTLYSDDRGEQAALIGAASVKSVSPDGKTVVVDQIEKAGKADPGSTRRIESSQATLGPKDEFSASVSRRRGIAAYDILYLQAGVAGGIVVLATALLYWLIALRPGPNEFLIAVDAEMRKVNWSTKREIYGSTMVVLVVFVSITVLIFGVDAGFSSLFRWIGVLGI